MQAVRLAYPLPGPLRVRNSPADRVPSHGSSAFASGHAIDLVPVDARGRSARVGMGDLLFPQPPQRFVGFGRSVIAPCAGTVVATHDGEKDHASHRGLPSLGYALGQARRVSGGWRALAGNHVILRLDDGRCHVALCHLQRGSLRVHMGQSVVRGEPLACCGNSGNSTEPHVHLQAMDAADPETAGALPMDLPGGVPRSGVFVRA